jgi:single-strand DNA-binding protein
MLNHITIMGRLTADPELRRTGAGVAVASFTVACDRDFTQNGQKEADFIDCVAWRGTGEFVDRNFSKGKMIVVSGRLQMRRWEDKNNNKRTTAEVVADNVYFGEAKNSGEAKDSVGERYRSSVNGQLDEDYPAIFGDDERLPF